MARPRKARSPIDERGRQLAEEEHKLQVQMAALQRELEEAPRRQAEEARQRREAFLERSRQGTVPPARNSRRGGGTGRRITPMLKRERRAARLKAMALFMIFLVVVVWLASSYLF